MAYPSISKFADFVVSTKSRAASVVSNALADAFFSDKWG